MPPNSDIRWQLRATDKGLVLYDRFHPKWQPLHIDFCQGKQQHRQTKATANNELLARAIGMKKYGSLAVTDCTAGLGTDANLLASLGCHVTLCEREPLLACLLEDAISRARETLPYAANLKLYHGDAFDYLQSITQTEVIYLDPMFPERKKSALVKKPMQILQALTSQEEDQDALFSLAQQKAKYRVIVKRPRHAAPLCSVKPNFNYCGNSVRFDIYLC